MNGITKRCISFAQGNKDPYQRVNYPFGLVLGVDEFVDEQCYFLEKEYMHNRALHGCGTISGLHVTVAAVNDDAEVQVSPGNIEIQVPPGDIEIRVSPGVGIDQYGRLFVIPTRQCASLRAWIAEQEELTSGEPIYVVARYAECETELVPIAGQPCSSSEQLSAPSRIKDFFEIDFRLERPPHAAHNAVINLAEFLHRLRLDPDAEDVGDLGIAIRLAAIIGPDFITDESGTFSDHIDQEITEIIGDGDDLLLRIRPDEINALLDDIFTYWLTEVRPTLIPDIITSSQPSSANAEPPPAEILLAQIDFELSESGELALETTIMVDNSVRPYLLHTQLIQELFDVQALTSEGGGPDRPVLEFATIEDIGPNSLSLWIHLDNAFELLSGENMTLFRVGDRRSLNPVPLLDIVERISSTDGGRRFELTTEETLNNNDYLLLRFDTNSIVLDTDSGEQTLTALLEDTPFTFLNYQPEAAQILTYHIVERADAVGPEQIREIIREMQQPRIPFVTITPITASEGQEEFLQNYELWFHLDGIVEKNGGEINLNPENVHLFAEDGSGNTVQIFIRPLSIRPNVWLANPLDMPERGLPFARFIFPLDVELPLIAFNPSADDLESFGTLREYMEITQQQLEGHIMESEEFGESLVVYVREQGSAREVEQ